MSINPAQLFDAYEQTRVIAAADLDLAVPFQPVETVFEDKKRQADAVIMVYGVYNAGKSTLINALLRSEVAATDDIPLTDKVTAYRWGSYSILDTPGVDAPIEHEDVTRAQMLKADVIIFVVDPLGTVEEAKTLDVLIDMVDARKKIYLVFNEKKQVDTETFVHLKEQVRTRLQALAAERGLADILKDIPISKVNARRALQGHLKGQQLMIEMSEFPAFEQQLHTFLQGIKSNDVYARLKQDLQRFLDLAVTSFEQRSTSDIVKKYDHLLQRISGERSRLSQDMKRELGRQRSHIYEMAKVHIRTAPEDCQVRLEELLHKAGVQVGDSLQHELQAVVHLVQTEIDEFQIGLPNVSHVGAPVSAPEFAEPGTADADHATALPTAPRQGMQFGDAAQQLGALAKPEHIVSGLKVVKDTLPSLMKGIGVKTMEKWAAAITGKWIPFVGLAVSVGEGLYTLFKGDQEAERLRQHYAEQQRAQERAVQQIDDFARELAEGFDTTMAAIAAKECDEFFDKVKLQVEQLRSGFDASEQDNSRQLEQVVAIREQVRHA